MKKDGIAHSSRNQAVAAWVDYLYRCRVGSILRALTVQDLNLNSALKELQKIKDFISNPSHILGNPATKHGEIAEAFQVYASNAKNLIKGLIAEYTFDDVGRLDPEDYLKNGYPVQSKFYHEYANTFKAVIRHSKTYRFYLRVKGTYDIPKSQYADIIDVLDRGDNARYSLQRSDETLYKSIREWEEQNSVKFQDVVKPAIVNYEDVQLNQADSTLATQKAEVIQEDCNIRKDIYREHSSSFKEASKVAGVSASLEGSMHLILAIISKLRDGKRITEFTLSDWKEVGIDTAKGVAKGGIRGSAIYYFVNRKNVSAPIANAVITAFFGIAAESIKLKQGRITLHEFYDNSIAISLDVAMSTVSAAVGSAIIPVPILGALIGNTVGMFVYNLSKDLLDKAELKEIEKINSNLAELHDMLNKEFHEYVLATEKRLSVFTDTLSRIFDIDSDIAFQGAIDTARLLGAADDELILSVDDAIKRFTT